jgi:uncharacterized membrane protein
MKPIIILLGSFIISLIVSKIAIGNWNLVFSGSIAMCLMLCFTAMGHFMFTKGMTMMMPEFIPFKKNSFMLRALRKFCLGSYYYFQLIGIGRLLLILMFVLLLPANIRAAITNLNLETAEYNDRGSLFMVSYSPANIVYCLGLVFSINNIAY